MNPKHDQTHPFSASIADSYPWQRQSNFPKNGANRRELIPFVEEAYLQAIAAQAWQTMRMEWEKNPPACKELARLPPDGCEALARYLAKHFTKRMPDAGITQEKFWDDSCIFNLRASHDYQEDDWFKAYLRFRADALQPIPFLRRVVMAADAKETPEVADRMLFCIFWDLFVLPMRYWSDDASAGLLCESGQSFNLDKVRNTRRELGLKRAWPVIVKKFKRLASTAPGASEQIEVKIDDLAAKRARMSGTLQSLLVFLKAPKFPSLKTV